MTRSEPLRGVASVVRYLRQNPNGAQAWQLRGLPVCSSTELCLSEWLREKPFSLNDKPRAIFAARQTHGRGQRGRVWQSPIGGVWISAAIPWPVLIQSNSLLGLAAAVALSERLEKYGVPVRIKWPNDLVVERRKLAGLLPTLVCRGSSVRVARLGLGLNVCNRVPKEGISLFEIMSTGKCNRDFWTAEVLFAFERVMNLAGSVELICEEVNRRLWAKEVVDPITGEVWDIKEVTRDGALSLGRGSLSTFWTC